MIPGSRDLLDRPWLLNAPYVTFLPWLHVINALSRFYQLSDINQVCFVTYRGIFYSLLFLILKTTFKGHTLVFHSLQPVKY